MRNLEYKDIVGKLMSQENISVVHRQHYPTAAFDLETRTLFLPEFVNLSESVYDLLIGHEVSHALNTPKDGWHNAISDKGANFKSFLNVVEDVRIERMIQNKFPGLKSSFKTGYKELYDNDFFGIKDKSQEELADMLLIDRVNLYFKLGELNCGVSFTEEERSFISEMFNLKTWEDVVTLAEKLFEYCKEEKKKKEEEKKSSDPESITGKLIMSDESSDSESESTKEEKKKKREEKEYSDPESITDKFKMSDNIPDSESESTSNENGDNSVDGESFAPTDEGESNEIREPFSETDRNFRKNEENLYNKEEEEPSKYRHDQSTSLDLPVVEEKYFYDDWKKIEKQVRSWMKKAEEYSW